ncbi:restriction endonuclease subunit S [Clostridium neonatale]|uniref:restriction endonuclease subunit S n=1 Tax=Clostridium neonatale TaxID=137838 RepID=UPI00291B39D7|nr:restriction endonuclease subunit S [Clostridium neonatale]CAI3655075.1 type I restriction enzyme, S subunit [Clostridium neonatale]CAI3721824.1 type I restriction enzyme, S subunit [Clostridium neonatale]
MKNVPKLRFNGFSDEWEEKKLGDVVKFYDNMRKPIKERERKQGIYPYYGATGIIDFIDDYIFDGEYLLLGEDGANIVTRSAPLIYLTSGKFWLNNHAHIFKTKDHHNMNYFKLYLETINYVPYNTGTAQPKLNIDNVKKILVKYPEFKEQERIADFLTKVDKIIEKQDEKVENLEKYKKGMMQKIFSQEVRFKKDDGEEYPEWEEKHLGSLVDRIVRKNKSNISNRPLTISAQYGLVDQEEFFNKVVASSNLEGYYLLNKGEFAYNKSYSNGYPFGAIKRLERYDKGAVSTLYICFIPKNNIDSNYLVQYFESTMWHKEISMIAVEGARNHGLLNISVDDFFDTIHKIPCLEEQQKIANFLSKIDIIIEKEKQQLEALREWKKGLLQQMFV